MEAGALLFCCNKEEEEEDIGFFFIRMIGQKTVANYCWLHVDWFVTWSELLHYKETMSHFCKTNHMKLIMKIINTYCFCLYVYFCRLAHLRWRLTRFGRVWFGAGLMCLSGKFWCICLILSLNIGVLTSEQTNVKGFESWFMVCYPIKSKATIIF